MIGGPIKLGVAAGVGYTLGGKLGMGALKMVKADADPDTVTGAAWAGRITLFLVSAYVLSRV